MKIQFSINGLQREVACLAEDAGFHVLKVTDNLRSGRFTPFSYKKNQQGLRQKCFFKK